MTVNAGGFQSAGSRLMSEVQQLTDAGVNTDGVMAALNAMDVATGDEVENIVPDPQAKVKEAQAAADLVKEDAEAKKKAREDAAHAEERRSAHADHGTPNVEPPPAAENKRAEAHPAKEAGTAKDTHK